MCKAHGGGTFPKLHCLILGHLFWTCPPPWSFMLHVPLSLLDIAKLKHWVDQSTNFSLDWEFTTFLNHLWYVSSCWTRLLVKAPCWWAGEGWTKSQAASCLWDMKKHNSMNLLLPGSNWAFSYWPNDFPTFVSSLLKGIIRHNHGLNHVLENDTKMSSTNN